MQVAKRLNAVGIVTPLHKHSCHFHGTIHHGAEHTKVKRATSPTARFFHVLNFVESGINPHSYWFWGWECLTARRQHGFTHVFKPSPTIALNRRMVVFKSRKGVKTMTITTPKTGTQSPTSRKSAAKATPNPTYCPRCNEQGIFCTCTPQIGDITTKLEVKRIKRGTFLSTFGDVGGAK